MERQSQCEAEAAVSQSLFFQPLCCGEYQRQLRKIYTQFCGYFRCHDFQAPDSQAGTKIEYRRDSQLLANRTELRAGEFSRFRGHQSAILNAS